MSLFAIFRASLLPQGVVSLQQEARCIGMNTRRRSQQVACLSSPSRGDRFHQDGSPSSPSVETTEGPTKEERNAFV
jgi:hypothetical protein